MELLFFVVTTTFAVAMLCGLVLGSALYALMWIYDQLMITKRARHSRR